MISSMTGFGSAEFKDVERTVSIEVRSINNRFLKINIRNPESLSNYEQEIERRIKDKISRGTIHVTIEYQATNSEPIYNFNISTLKAYYKLLQDVKREIEYDKEISIDSLISLPGVIERVKNHEPDTKSILEIVCNLLDSAMEDMLQMRVRGGSEIQREIKGRQMEIETLLEKVENMVPVALAGYIERLHERIMALLKGSEVTPTREDLHKEVAIFAARSDITEEIKLLRSHMAQLDEIMDKGGYVGKKLEFVVQEMFRESNTMASKSNNEKMLYNIINIKTEVEKIKELVLNIE